MAKIFKIAKIIDDYTIVINAGTNQNLKENQRFLIFSLDGEDVFDPDTNEFLGKLEVTKGTGQATSVQEKMCTIKSDMTRFATSADVTNYSLLNVLSTFNEANPLKIGDELLVAFKSPQKGDLIKPV